MITVDEPGFPVGSFEAMIWACGRSQDAQEGQ